MPRGVNVGSGVKLNSAPHPVVLSVSARRALPFFSVLDELLIPNEGQACHPLHRAEMLQNPRSCHL